MRHICRVECRNCKHFQEHYKSFKFFDDVEYSCVSNHSTSHKGFCKDWKLKSK